MVRRFKIADVVFDAEYTYAYTDHVLRNYRHQGQSAEFLVKITDSDIQKENELSGGEFEKPYLESLCVYRKLLEKLLDKGAIVFHSSAVAVDGKAYLFTAPSGTGKSTHVALWKKLFGERAVVINDDKPIIRLVDGEFYVYGTPWNGKHDLDTNCKAKLKAICKLERGEKNKIEKMQTAKMLPTLLAQTLRPSEAVSYDKLLDIIGKILTQVELYRLECNVDISSAELSFKVMSGEGKV